MTRVLGVPSLYDWGVMGSQDASNLELELIERALARAPQEADGPGLAHRVQTVLGYVPEQALESIAARLGVERESLMDLIAKDDSLRSEPAGRYRVLVCTGRTCAIRGGAQLLRQAREKLGIEVFESTENEAVRLEPFRCFGRCAQAPNVRFKGELRGAMTEKRFDLLLDMMMRSKG